MESTMMRSLQIPTLIIICVVVMMFVHNQSLVSKTELDTLDAKIGRASLEPKVQYSLEYDPNCELCKSRSKKKVHIVTTFFHMALMKGTAKLLLPNSDWGDKVKIDKREAKSMFQKRDRELLDVLQMNLMNPCVMAVHIVYNNEKVVEHIMSQKLRFTDKLIFHLVANPTYQHIMLYIGKYLRHQLVVFANQDIYLGRGWKDLNHDLIEERRIMYALTRHGKRERYCRMPDNCAHSQPYLGSHDAFAFILTEMPNPKHFALLNHRGDQFGVENILIFVFNIKLGYEVINPCFVLFVYHVHCSRIFSNHRVRVNRFNNTGMAHFMDQLYV